MKKTLAAAWLVSTCLMGVTPALAQTAPATGATDDDIVVTARKREENLIDVPLAVTVATAAQLARDQVYNLSDHQRITRAHLHGDLQKAHL